MKTKAATWFLCKIKYAKVMEDGTSKNVTEQYCIDALSFTEAENFIIDEAKDFISGEFDVKGITLAPFTEVFFTDTNSEEYWYKVKVAFINYDEKTGKERKSGVVYLVQANNIKEALHNTESVMDGSLTDYTISAISETNIYDVFEYNKG